MASFNDMKSVDEPLGYAPINPDGPSFAPKHQPLELGVDNRHARRERLDLSSWAAVAVYTALVWLAARGIYQSNVFTYCFHGKQMDMKVCNN